MTQEERAHHSRIETWFEATSWILAIGLAALAYAAAPRGQMDALFAVSAGLAASAILYYRLMPVESRRGLVYGPEDKVLAGSLTIFVLITVYFYAFAALPQPLVFLYFIPILLAALMLDEKIVLAETAIAVLSVTFLHALRPRSDEFFDVSFVLLLAVFLIIAGVTIFLTGELRKQSQKTSGLLKELSLRLDQIQVVNVIVRQIEFFSKFETLLSKTTDIVANAFGARICGIYIKDPQSGELDLRSESSGIGPRERELLAAPAAVAAFKDAFESGQPVVLDGLGFSNAAAAPLRVREDRLGVIFVAEKTGGFIDAETSFLDLLGGYIAALIDSSMLFQHLNDERQDADRMTRLLVGRELKMKDLKDRLARHEGL
jgi:K+-sensing histidine kinase KdpD